MMRRREFIMLLGGAAAWPTAARAQLPTPVVGFLGDTSREWASYVAAFVRGLKEIGYVDGGNIRIEYRWSEGRYLRLPELVAELVRQQVGVIFASAGTPAALAAKAATSTIPIVFMVGGDPVELGLVDSFNRPGGNITGVFLFAQAVEAKKLELLGKLVPRRVTFAYLLNPNNPAAEGKAKEMRDAARSLDRQLHVLSAGTDDEINVAFATLTQLRAGALVVSADPFFDSHRDKLVALAARDAVPAIYQWREFTAEGGLMSYGNSLSWAYHQSGMYTGRMLKGAKPADLPVVQPTKVELVINLKTAKALGLEVPPTVIAVADEVIE
jgi:putative ABC transport system substrate-binding protein